jgi:ribulose bisphosphate carboxylase small subunit
MTLATQDVEQGMARDGFTLWLLHRISQTKRQLNAGTCASQAYRFASEFTHRASLRITSWRRRGNVRQGARQTTA